MVELMLTSQVTLAVEELACQMAKLDETARQGKGAREYPWEGEVLFCGQVEPMIQLIQLVERQNEQFDVSIANRAFVLLFSIVDYTHLHSVSCDDASFLIDTEWDYAVHFLFEHFDISNDSVQQATRHALMDPTLFPFSILFPFQEMSDGLLNDILIAFEVYIRCKSSSDLRMFLSSVKDLIWQRSRRHHWSKFSKTLLHCFFTETQHHFSENKWEVFMLKVPIEWTLFELTHVNAIFLKHVSGSQLSSFWADQLNLVDRQRVRLEEEAAQALFDQLCRIGCHTSCSAIELLFTVAPGLLSKLNNATVALEIAWKANADDLIVDLLHHQGGLNDQEAYLQTMYRALHQPTFGVAELLLERCLERPDGVAVTTMAVITPADVQFLESAVQNLQHHAVHHLALWKPDIRHHAAVVQHFVALCAHDSCSATGPAAAPTGQDSRTAAVGIVFEFLQWQPELASRPEFARFIWNLQQHHQFCSTLLHRQLFPRCNLPKGDPTCCRGMTFCRGTACYRGATCRHCRQQLRWGYLRQAFSTLICDECLSHHGGCTHDTSCPLFILIFGHLCNALS